MNLSRFKYILLSQTVLLPLVFIAKLTTHYIFNFNNSNSIFDLLTNINDSIFIAAFFAIILSTSKKVIIRFLDDTFTLKFNFTLVSLYLTVHYFISYFILSSNSLKNQNYSYIYVFILLVAIIYSNIKFKKALNEKK